ncbi:MAG: ACP S-malonyltransferase [Chloroflexi bacterium]|nr:ACP S-malonyltransferase [Chloroflexota bacterium]MBM3173045.1 ACP S-malonyltransferase [Chloroflexota bacterium]MBM3174155.1 ACP S-malonyltransferase [Chloroflexota bacterium]MBM4449223.1 ACP S-malonyltransferase [Chloroflexota bacterium]
MVEEIKAAYVFPGQDSLTVGMGLDLYVHYSSAREVFDEVDKTLGFSLSRLCFEGPEEDLRQTANAQPAVVTTSVACLKAAQEASQNGLPTPMFVAGHGVGAYSALVAAEVLGLSDAVRLVRERGRLMNEAGQRTPGGMLSMSGLNVETVRDICLSTGSEIAYIDAADQVTISGTQDSLTKARRLAQIKGARRILPLKVTGPFYSSLMEPSLGRLRNAISGFTFNKPTVPVMANVTAQALTDLEAIKEELVSQVVHTIMWLQTVENMIARGVTTFFEMGPGEELSKVIKRISPGAQTFNISTAQTVTEITRWRKG